MPDLSIIIPCYNEAGNIPLIVARITVMLLDTENVEVLLVNNGSTDNSAEVLYKEVSNARTDSIRVVDVPENRGYGYGILSGLKEAKGDFYSWTHADMQTDPEDVLKAFEIIQTDENPESVFLKGIRKNRNLLDEMFTLGMGIYSSLKLKVWLQDINAQPKLFHKSFFHSLDNPPHDFSLDLFVYYEALKRGLKVETIPVYFRKRLHGEAKGGGSLKTKWPLIVRTFKYINELTVKIKQ